MPRARKLPVVRFPLTMRSEQDWLDLRQQDVTASDVGALFGMHPYQTVSGLWAVKTGCVLPSMDSNIKRRGRLFEDAVGKAWLEEHPGWKLKKAQVYLRAPTLRLGATPDFYITKPDGERGVLQTKTTNPSAFKKFWTDETPPTWVVLQTITEMMLSRVTFGQIAVLVISGYGTIELRTYDVPRHEGAERRIQETVRKFWEDLNAGIEPQIDYMRDRALIDVMYPHAQDGTYLDLRGDNQLPELLKEREQMMAEAKYLRECIDKVETELRAKMKDSESAIIGDGWRATLKDQTRKEYTVKEKTFRVLRITRDEQSEKAA
jgi:predicted phage-related endonuclease